MPLGVAVFWLLRSSRTQAWPKRPPRWQASVAILLLGAFSLGSSVYLKPALRKWRLVGPAIYGLALDVGREVAGGDAPRDMQRAVAALQRQIDNPHGSPEYPLWRNVPDEAQRLAEFRARPLERKPDVILVVIESLRGWTLDWRDAQAARLAPNMAALWKERGVAYPYAHSNGFPSGEGNMSVHLGLWSHPRRAIFAEHLAIRTLSLPEILGQAGYHRIWLTASDPSFDNMQPWIRRWYDEWVIDHGGDDSLTRKMIERYDAAPPDAPRLMTMYTGTMHPPFRVPASFGPRLEDPDQAYLQALRFTDRALGQLFDHLRASGRWQNTVVICVGDHGQPSPWHLAHAEDLPPAHAGYTWIGMLLAAPGLGPGPTGPGHRLARRYPAHRAGPGRPAGLQSLHGPRPAGAGAGGHEHAVGDRRRPRDHAKRRAAERHAGRSGLRPQGLLRSAAARRFRKLRAHHGSARDGRRP